MSGKRTIRAGQRLMQAWFPEERVRQVRYIALRSDSSASDVLRAAVDALVEAWVDPATGQHIPQQVSLDIAAEAS